MAKTSSSSSSPPNSAIDPRTGFCRQTKTFHSLRPPAPLPPPSVPHSVATYALSLLPSPIPSTAAFVDAGTGRSLSFPDFISQFQTLAASLRSALRLSKGQVAFILSPPTLEVPVLYFALFSIGAILSPANPTSTAAEISHEFDLTKPSIAFTTSSLAHKLPRHVPTVLLDSPHFRSLLISSSSAAASPTILQSDPAAILFSSGTTGKVKGVSLSHRNFIAITAAYFSARKQAGDSIPTPVMSLFTIPVFHVFGFLVLVRSVALGDTTVLMERFEFRKMLRAVEKYRVMFMPVSPPVILAMAKSDEVPKHDLSSLLILGCGGAPLGKEVAEKFKERFPNVEIIQGYGLTESAGGVAGTSGPEENRVYGSVGRIAANVEAKVVDPISGETLGPGQPGELWLSGPPIMKGYVGNDEATASTLTSEGWLKTGDLCYFNQDGFLFIVDRLKELIKYKAYQVPPAELELILQSHPDIADAAVIPYPDEEAGEIPMAIVVRQPRSTLSEEEVMNFVAKQVAPYKKIRRVLFTSSIPKSDTGKILRRELKNQVLSNPTSKL